MEEMVSQFLNGPPPSGCFMVGRWHVEPAASELQDGDLTVRLRPKTMDLLVVLAEKPGEVLGTRDLLDRVWPDVVVGDASLSMLVVELRKALGDDPKNPEFIETIPRKGYRLIAPVSWIEAPQATRFALVGAETRVLLFEGENLIGRDPESHVRIDSVLVSRRHGRIVITGENVTIEDLGSKNGTYFNGNRLQGPEPLFPGDRITIGRLAATYCFVIVSDTATVTEASKVDSSEQ